MQAGEITADSLLKVLSFGRAPSTSPAAAPDHSVSGNATAAAAARASKLLLARPTGAAGAPQAAEDSRLRTDGQDGASWARVSSMYRKAWTPALRAVRLLQTRVDRTYDAQAHLAPEWRSSFRSELRQAMMSFDKRRAPHPAMRSPAPSTQLAHTVGVAPLDDTSAAPHHSFTTPLPTPLAPSLYPRAPLWGKGILQHLPSQLLTAALLRSHPTIIAPILLLVADRALASRAERIDRKLVHEKQAGRAVVMGMHAAFVQSLREVHYNRLTIPSDCKADETAWQRVDEDKLMREWLSNHVPTEVPTHTRPQTHRT